MLTVEEDKLRNFSRIQSLFCTTRQTNKRNCLRIQYIQTNRQRALDVFYHYFSWYLYWGKWCEVFSSTEDGWGFPEGNVFLSVDLWATQHTFFLFFKERRRRLREWRDREDELRYLYSYPNWKPKKCCILVVPRTKGLQHKVHIYHSTTVSVLSSELSDCDPPTPCPASECVPPRLRVRGWGVGRLEKKPSTLSTLWLQMWKVADVK